MMLRMIMAALTLAIGMAATPAMAQDRGELEARVKKLEGEVRAVQRKVFPGGSDRFFEPEIEAQQGPSNPTSTGASANSAVSDLLLRVDALEAQIARITSQSEENGYQLAQFETRLAALEAAEAERAKAIEAERAAEERAARDVRAEEAAAVNAERQALVDAVEKPVTGDAGEDAYLYGYRLWEAKLYPEAQEQLADMITAYPKHKRLSFARNLLGRAYLDGGNARRASEVLLGNYQVDPDGERAPDSLYFLAEALVALGRKPAACDALVELAEVYPAEASGRLADRVAAGRRSAGCK